MSGEKNKLDNQEAYKERARELLDVIQTSFTMMRLLKKEEGIDINAYIEEHIAKLISKGYIEVG